MIIWALLPLDFSMAIPNTTPESATPAILSSVRPQCWQRPSPSGSGSPPSFHPSLTDRLSVLSTSTSMYETWLLLVAWSSDDVMAVSGWPLWRTLRTLAIIEIQTLPWSMWMNEKLYCPSQEKWQQKRASRDITHDRLITCHWAEYSVSPAHVAHNLYLSRKLHSALNDCKQ